MGGHVRCYITVVKDKNRSRISHLGTVTAVVVGTLIALWRGGELAYWHIGVGAAVALTALLKNIIVYRTSVGG